MKRSSAIRRRSSIAAISFLALTSPQPSRPAITSGSSRKMSPGPRISPSSQNAVMCLVAEPLDVEAVARHEMPQPLDRLRGADQAAGAAPRHLPRLAHREAAADRAMVGKLVGHGILGAVVEHDPDDLRDHIAGALDDDGVADADVLARDLVLVVQGGALHDDAAHGDRLQHRHRGQARPAARPR